MIYTLSYPFDALRWQIRRVRTSHGSCLLVAKANEPSMLSKRPERVRKDQICPGLNANEIQIPYDGHHKASSLVKSHQNTCNSVKYMKDITRWREDMNFMFEWQERYHTSERSNE